MHQSNLFTTCLLLILTFFIGHYSFAQYSEFEDARDGRIYKSVELNGILWMVNNLDYETRNGSFYYENNTKFKGKAGHLYTFAAAQNACPKTWRLPTLAEWEGLIDLYGGLTAAYSPLTLKGSTGLNITWGGLRRGNGQFLNKTKVGSFWTSTVHSNNSSRVWRVNFKRADQVIKKNAVPKGMAMSCRCVKDLEQKVNDSSDNTRVEEAVATPYVSKEFTLKFKNKCGTQIRYKVKRKGKWSEWEYIKGQGQEGFITTDEFDPFEGYKVEYKHLYGWEAINSLPRLNFYENKNILIGGNPISGGIVVKEY